MAQLGNYSGILVTVIESFPNSAVPSGYALKEKFNWCPPVSTIIKSCGSSQNFLFIQLQHFLLVFISKQSANRREPSGRLT